MKQQALRIQILMMSKVLVSVKLRGRKSLII